MKKLVYSLAVLFSVALVSCGGNKAAEADSANDTANVEVTEVTETVVDSAVADSAAPVADSVKADSAK
ncbi:MAG: entericidin [Muribaculaceae bacterium]|nr:entericidin [Muribaculaceae bacterium]MDE6410662.1 entericidin [Muribaculaceae bacterium]